MSYQLFVISQFLDPSVVPPSGGQSGGCPIEKTVPFQGLSFAWIRYFLLIDPLPRAQRNISQESSGKGGEELGPAHHERDLGRGLLRDEVP